jgi:ribosomal protein S27AE
MKKSEANLNLLGKKCYYIREESIPVDPTEKCLDCLGDGSLLNKHKVVIICRRCGGKGLTYENGVNYIDTLVVEEGVITGISLEDTYLLVVVDDEYDRQFHLVEIFFTKKEAQTQADKLNKKRK